MLHARQDYMRIQDPENKIGEDEPVFLLRAKDSKASYAVRSWASQVALGGDTKLAEVAYNWADEMDVWRKENGGKFPDADTKESNITKINK